MRGKKNSIIINGREYDAITGLPMVQTIAQTAVSPTVAKPTVAAKPAPITFKKSPVRVMSDIRPARHAPPKPTKPAATFTPATAVKKPVPASRATPHPVAGHVHQTPQRSQTLYRRATKKPVPEVTAPQRSAMITRFAPHPKPLHHHTAAKPAVVAAQPAPKPVAKPEVQPAVVKKHVTQSPEQLSSRMLKEQLIKERLAEVDSHKKAPATTSGIRKLFQQLKKPRAVHITAVTLAFLLLGGYFAYINMPNLSVKVAASRAGVNASYPEYKPDGYQFNGPVAYAPGEVSLEFSSNTNDQAYTIAQRSSNWDSQAVLDNFVAQKTDSYLTYSEQGLTIYTFENKAAWVNHGVLYTIEGDAALSSDQILDIAASL